MSRNKREGKFQGKLCGMFMHGHAHIDAIAPALINRKQRKAHAMWAKRAYGYRFKSSKYMKDARI